MTDNIITTHEPSSWLDPYVSPPASGSRVQGLTVGLVQVSCIWTSDWQKYFVGWQPHSKIPATIRARVNSKENLV